MRQKKKKKGFQLSDKKEFSSPNIQWEKWDF